MLPNDQLGDRRPARQAPVMLEILARVPGCDDVNNGVPPALEWQNKGAHKLERRRRALSVNERVDPVGAGWNPGD